MKPKPPLKGQVAAIAAETGIDKRYVKAILTGKKIAGVKTTWAIVSTPAAKGRWKLTDLRNDLSEIVKEP